MPRGLLWVFGAGVMIATLAIMLHAKVMTKEEKHHEENIKFRPRRLSCDVDPKETLTGCKQGA